MIDLFTEPFVIRMFSASFPKFLLNPLDANFSVKVCLNHLRLSRSLHPPVQSLHITCLERSKKHGSHLPLPRPPLRPRPRQHGRRRHPALRQNHPRHAGALLRGQPLQPHPRHSRQALPTDTDHWRSLGEQQTFTPAPPTPSAPGARTTSSPKSPKPPSTATPRPTPFPTPTRSASAAASSPSAISTTTPTRSSTDTSRPSPSTSPTA